MTHHGSAGRRPYLNDSTINGRAPAVAVSGRDGQIRHDADGVYASDRRMQSSAILTVDREEPEAVVAQSRGRIKPGSGRTPAEWSVLVRD